MLYPQNGGRSYRDHRLSGVISVTLCITSSVVDVGVGVAGPGRPALEYLSLADCGLVQIDVDAFSGLRNLTSLTLSRCLVNESLLARAFDKAAFRSRLMRLDIIETHIRVRVSVCSSLCQSVDERIHRTTRPIFLSSLCARFLWPLLGPPLTALRYVMCFRFFVDDIVFASNASLYR